MRTIKFKAKTIDGEWVESPSIQNNPFGKIYLMDTKRLVECYNKEVMPSNIWIEIDPNTLCQFTGVVDENGVEGCRYDKVLSPIYGEGFIQWCNDTAGFYIDFGYDEYSAKMIHLKDCEIIGNIHNKIGER